MDLVSISKEYFNNLNALSEKIAADIQNTQDAYQDLWRSLSRVEQEQAIDESIINPSAVIKYANLPVQALKQNYNAYSWFTKSQLNLFSKLDLMGYPDSGKNAICRNEADQVSKTVLKEKDKSCLANGTLNKSKSSLKNTEEKPTKAQKNSVLKPKTPPPPPPPKISTIPAVQEDILKDQENLSNDIPKTGFDFLDNW